MTNSDTARVGAALRGIAMLVTNEVPLADDVAAALSSDNERQLTLLADREPESVADRLTTLLHIYNLHMAPLDSSPLHAVRYQHHPAIAAIKMRCEQSWIDDLVDTTDMDANEIANPIEALRTLAARDRLPAIYRWVAQSASPDEVAEFLVAEGGPDGGFDDLVALCQIGISGRAKVEMANNYWDEMGNGDATAVHTVLHDQLIAGLPDLPRRKPVTRTSALARSAMGGLLATNRWLQPELVGALGLIELQAGPRSRLVLQALQRCGFPETVQRFYAVHAEVDPVHGQDWLDKVVSPLVDEHPHWKARILRGAHWRDAVNRAFLIDVTDELMNASLEAA